MRVAFLVKMKGGEVDGTRGRQKSAIKLAAGHRRQRRRRREKEGTEAIH